MRKKLTYIDMLRGYAILLVMIGHLEIPHYLHIYIYSFHVPLFFFISGYFFKDDNAENIRGYIVKGIKHLIVPGILLGLIANIISKIINNENVKFLNIIFSLFIEIRGNLYAIIPWFLISLFLSQILLCYIIKIANKVKVEYYILCITCLNILYIMFIHKPLPWNIDILGITLSFYYLGYYFRKFEMKIENIFNNYKLILLFIFQIIFAVMNDCWFGGADLYAQKIGFFVLYYLSSVFGIIVHFFMFKKYIRIYFLEYLGNNTLFFYVFHQVIFAFLKINYSELNIIFIFLISNFILILFSMLINRYIPFIVGKQKQEI